MSNNEEFQSKERIPGIKGQVENQIEAHLDTKIAEALGQVLEEPLRQIQVEPLNHITQMSGREFPKAFPPKDETNNGPQE